MNGGIISNNSAQTGGGIYSFNESKCSNMIINDGEIINNNASQYGGGFYLSGSSHSLFTTVTITGGTISNNIAPNGEEYHIASGRGVILDQR